jgi:glycine/D-amino acid oxidase-like deaminating enzyme
MSGRLGSGDRYDTIVVGVGAMGSAAAYQLARRGQRVLALERFGVTHERGSHHGLTRIIRLAYHEDTRYVPLLLHAYDLWRELERCTVRLQCPHLSATPLGRPRATTDDIRLGSPRRIWCCRNWKRSGSTQGQRATSNELESARADLAQSCGLPMGCETLREVRDALLIPRSVVRIHHGPLPKSTCKPESLVVLQENITAPAQRAVNTDVDPRRPHTQALACRCAR